MSCDVREVILRMPPGLIMLLSSEHVDLLVFSPRCWITGSSLVDSQRMSPTSSCFGEHGFLIGHCRVFFMLQNNVPFFFLSYD
jgi:hypothetical protein